MHIVKPNAINADWSLFNNKKCIPNIHHKDQCPLISALIHPSELEVHRQVPLTDGKIAPSKKTAQQNLLQKFDSILSKTVMTLDGET